MDSRLETYSLFQLGMSRIKFGAIEVNGTLIRSALNGLKFWPLSSLRYNLFALANNTFCFEVTIDLIGKPSPGNTVL